MSDRWEGQADDQLRGAPFIGGAVLAYADRLVGTYLFRTRMSNQVWPMGYSMGIGSLASVTCADFLRAEGSPFSGGAWSQSLFAAQPAHWPWGGSHSSTLFPSGSMTQANFPYSDSS